MHEYKISYEYKVIFSSIGESSDLGFEIVLAKSGMEALRKLKEMLEKRKESNTSYDEYYKITDIIKL